VALPPKKPGAPRIGGLPGNVPPDWETGKERLANEQLTDLVGSLEEELEEIKVKYEMYFIGAERMEPARRRDDLKRSIARLKNAFTRNAGIRFRIQALHARYLSYERLWLRSTREKEAGTYRRDLLKARKKAADRKEAPEAGEAVPEPPAISPAAPAPVPSPLPPPPVAARFKAKRVEFKVAVKDGKAVLTAVPKI
jgi:hypothetical protein